MPIEYGTPINPYVNRGSVEVAKLLSNRFANNLMYSNELEEQLANLQVADFQGDMAAKFALEQQTKKTLDGLATRGDYENLTVPIVRASQDFTEQYAPLQQNYKLYEEAKKMEQERVMRGDITKDQYDNWLRRSKYTNDPATGDLGLYSGVRRREDGNVDPSSFFQHVPIARAVNVDDEIIKMINTLDPEKRGGRSATSFQTGADGIRYVVDSQGEIIEQITPDRVAAVTRQVLDRSDVRSYLEQEADFNTFEASPEELQMMLRQRQSQLHGKASHANHAREIGAALNSGSTGQMRAMARKILQDQEAERYMDMAIKAGATTSRYGGGFSMKIDTDYYSLMSKGGGDQNTLNPPILAGQPQTATNAAAAAGGGKATPESMQKAVQQAETELETQRKLVLERHGFKDGKGILPGTLMNISNHSTKEIEMRYGYLGPQAVSDLIAYRDLQTLTNRKTQALQELDRSAREKSGFTQEQAIDNVLIKIGNEHGVQADQIGDQILNKISEKYDVSSEDALRIFAANYKNDFNIGTSDPMDYRLGVPLPAKNTGNIVAQESLPAVLQKVFGIDAADAAKIARETPARSYYLDGIFQTGFAEELNAKSINSEYSNRAQQYRTLLEQSSQSQLAFATSGVMFGDSSPKNEMSETLTKSLKDYSPVFFGSLTDRRTGESISQILGEQAASYSISDVKYTHVINPDNTISANAVQMTFKPGQGIPDKTDKIVIVPYEDVVHNYTVSTPDGPIDVNQSTNQAHSNKLLSQVYTTKINNPFAETVVIDRQFNRGGLTAEFIFEETASADGISYPNIVAVRSTFTDAAGRPNTNTMPLDVFLSSYTKNVNLGIFED